MWVVWLNAPDEVAEVGEYPVFEQAAGGSLALDGGGGDHRSVAREQLATPDNSHKKSKRETYHTRTAAFRHRGVDNGDV